MLGIPIGLAYANLSEWAIHKYVLHGLGKKPGSFWSFHWHEHHRAARAHNHHDPSYEQSLLRSLRASPPAPDAPPKGLRERLVARVTGLNAQAKEAVALMAGAALIVPLAPVAPFFVGTVWYSQLNYYRQHKRAHLDPAWARANLPWHYDHHMGPEQDANWCVTRPWFDDLLGTRKPYLGTEKATRDEARRAAKAATNAVKAAPAVRSLVPA